ncbi:hypothetical protein BN946_scf184768.g4 [Trametes cinnabarina]|uniref:Uncharacterized protein n=1 Tax=Pycnoporus cinnabarinus TaxID=5643 RepID=A0A060SN11_PYCCI|nr:hypothetical protein BN946_scf184768.g4 [Trametes cinnabarina]
MAVFSMHKGTHDSFCYLCQNGGCALACDLCPRVLCSEHIEQFKTIPAQDRASVRFVCPACHVIIGRSRTSSTSSLRDAIQRAPGAPYRAFYIEVNKKFTPYFANPVNLTTEYHISQSARVNTSPIFILHLRLECLEEEGSVASVFFHALKPYFANEDTIHLHYADVPFNLNTDSDAEKHRRLITTVVEPLSHQGKARVLVFVYTHSHDVHGTLYYGTNLASQTVDNWFDVLFPPDVRDVLRVHDTSLFMLCCGALVNTTQSYQALKGNCATLQIRRLIAFEASHFQAALTVSFFLGYAQKFLIENVTFADMHLADLLWQSLSLGRHSRVLLMQYNPEDPSPRVAVSEYRWIHKGVRPWGYRLPIQCPSCHGLFTFKNKEELRGAIVSRCKTRDCTYSQTFNRPDDTVVLKRPEGAWMKLGRE